MASERSGDASLSLSVPESLSRWLDDKAREQDVSREEILVQLLSTYQVVDDAGDGESPADRLDSLLAASESDLEHQMDQHLEDRDVPTDVNIDDRVEQALSDRLDGVLEDRLDELLEDRLDELLEEHESDVDGDVVTSEEFDDFETAFMEKIEDVRDRVVQVKREADKKASADHGHAELASVQEGLEDLDDEVSDVATSLSDLQDRVDQGFDNFEEVMEYLTDTTDRLESRTVTLAHALVETREELQKLASRDAARSAAENLQEAASQYGVRKAKCDHCETTVDVALLTRAECPHCSSPFVGIEPSSGFFGQNTLETGQRPALAGSETAPGDDGFDMDIQEIIDESDEQPNERESEDTASDDAVAEEPEIDE